MQQYTFTCPLPGCGHVLSVHAQSREDGAKMLVEEAHKHLATAHPEVHKTHEEVTADISSHMAETEE